MRSAVRLLIMQAIAKTPTLCMACGRPGTGQQNTDVHLVCCDEHGELLRRRPADFLTLVHPGVRQARSVPAHCSTPCAASKTAHRVRREGTAKAVPYPYPSTQSRPSLFQIDCLGSS
ncbi:hypothetical protein LP417_06180 [Polaromonas sp. P1-6]|nr:hypothetical protein LP417_06180 [Polaromonas sp. P1-6]